MKTVVTGGGGFLGRYIVASLLARGDAVHVIGRQDYPDLRAQGAVCHRIDLASGGEGVDAALLGAQVVYHAAARAAIWGRWDDFYRDNVVATQKVLQAAIRCKVPKFVYTSSPSVVMGANDIDLAGVNESMPYPERYLSHYPRTKAMAERLVLEQREILTVALRPHLIWGPHDRHLIPRVLARARSGRLVRIGDGNNLVDVTFVENAAHAHLQAADALGARSGLTSRAYFLGQAQPVNLWQFIDELVTGVGLPSVQRAISARFAMLCGAALERIHGIARSQREPALTRFMVTQLSTSHWFNHSAAVQDFGYRPLVSTQEGLRHTLASLNQQAQGCRG